ncbi:MAG: universal stress protein [Fuerstiella sp.]|nr:universal stress protein [Fuerstiella sp.]MCP4787822.1 universal stress protein [Fuerstiella sp.]MCP4853332.1 universal stress protein [Fuerstiella sp.]
MHSIKTIVVGVEMPESRPWIAEDIAPTSRRAVRQSFDIADAMNAAVRLVCVLPDVSAGFFGSEEDAAAEAKSDHAAAMKVLADLELQYMESTSRAIDVSSIVTTGQAWFEILKVAGTDRNNMIVCGTRQKGTVTRLLFGSTGRKLLRNAACPVWLLKPRVDDDANLDILAATDLSEVGEEVLHVGVALGQSLPVRLNVLHVVNDDLDRHMARTGVSEEELEEYRRNSKEVAEATLHEQLSVTDYRTVAEGVQTHIGEGAADGCILSAIKELDIDLLIMATSGRGGIPGMLFGNTAERLLPELPCSILAIKPDDFVCPVALD